jgi:hypothetical protein
MVINDRSVTMATLPGRRIGGLAAQGGAAFDPQFQPVADGADRGDRAVT